MAGPQEVKVGGKLTEFPGSSWNLFVREWFRQHAMLGRRGTPLGDSSDCIIATARNLSGEQLTYGDAVAIEGLAAPFDTKPKQQYSSALLKAQGHTSELKHAVMGVSVGTVKDNGVGSFIIAGGVWIRCNVTDTGHNFVALEQNQTSFSPLAISSSAGFPILDREDASTGTKWVYTFLGGGGGTAAPGGDVRIVLIEEDILAVTEREHVLVAADIELTNEEEDDETEVVFEDPEGTEVDQLELLDYTRTKISVKYFADSAIALSGELEGAGETTITLPDDASDEDGYYDRAIVTLTDTGESNEIESYAGPSHVATMADEWEDTPPSNGDEFELTMVGQKLVTTITDEAGTPPRKIVRHARMDILCDESEKFEVGTYKQIDYADVYDENADWPPPGLPANFMNKRYRAIAVKDSQGHWILDTIFCTALPPRELPGV